MLATMHLTYQLRSKRALSWSSSTGQAEVYYGVAVTVAPLRAVALLRSIALLLRCCEPSRNAACSLCISYYAALIAGSLLVSVCSYPYPFCSYLHLLR